MKKFLLCMLAAGLMVPAIAQEKKPAAWSTDIPVSAINRADLGISSQSVTPFKPNNSIVEIPVNGWTYSGTSMDYDLQAQGTPYPMTHVFKDGSVGSTWTTVDNDTPFPGASASLVYRGIGYNFSSDGGATWGEPTNRTGGIPLYWPSYTAWGPNGEAILARAGEDYPTYGVKDGLVLLTRENKGEGDWNIIPVPAPSDCQPGDVLVWARMVSTGDNDQTLHIVTGLSLKDTSEAGWYHGYQDPIIYNKTDDGGKTWGEWRVIPEMAGVEWDPRDDYYVESYNWVKSFDNKTIACTFSRMFGDLFIIKSEDNGETWTSIPVYNCTIVLDGLPTGVDTVHVATRQFNAAFDKNGKLHAAFSTQLAKKADANPGYYNAYYGGMASALIYWNEDMEAYDSESLTEAIDLFTVQYYAEGSLSLEGGTIIGKVETPVVGTFVPLVDPGSVAFNQEVLSWAIDTYGRAGYFTMPILTYAGDALHVFYIGLLDANVSSAVDANGHGIRQPFHIATADDGATWSETDYLVNYIEVIDWEFTYPCFSGLYNKEAYIMYQCDQYAGTYMMYNNQEERDQSEVSNNRYYLIRAEVGKGDISSIENTSLSMSLMPNPALGQVTVKFDGKANITVHNLLGQQVYHVENVENTKVISTDNMQSGVYFVTVRSGNRTQTQKLIVR